MKSKIAVSAAGLGKKFLIGSRGDRRTVIGRVRRALTGETPHRELWAVRGVDLEIRRGEIFGIVGPNGAGKSTLLLMLAGILVPTEGRLDVRGKTDPFFQLAAGLRTPLTVLENFALCAALLGLSRAQFAYRLPQIVEFSGLGDYLYARYGELSTGFAARLPFSVALHAELDIILIDEMLAVGDREFQAKCLEAIRGLAARGKTVILVSHNLALVSALCARALHIVGGRSAFCGAAQDAIARMVGVDSCAA